MIPWPESLLAEIHLLRGDDGAAQDMFEHAYTIGRQIGDPCWESLGARGLGRVAAHRGDLDQALPLLENAPRICRRLPDTYLWIEAYGLDALCSFAVDHNLASAPQWANDLQRVSDSAGFRELKVKALLYRARLGEPGALSAAQAAAEGFDNPLLASEIACVTGRLIPTLGPTAARDRGTRLGAALHRRNHADDSRRARLASAITDRQPRGG